MTLGYLTLKRGQPALRILKYWLHRATRSAGLHVKRVYVYLNTREISLTAHHTVDVEAGDWGRVRRRPKVRRERPSD